MSDGVKYQHIRPTEADVEAAATEIASAAIRFMANYSEHAKTCDDCRDGGLQHFCRHTIEDMSAATMIAMALQNKEAAATAVSNLMAAATLHIAITVAVDRAKL
jgi:hypothetical protein